jgi:hypothetical protein
MLDSDDRNASADQQASLQGQSRQAPSHPVRATKVKDEVPYDGTISLVGHRVRQDSDAELHVEVQIICEGRTFSGTASGSVALPDRLRVPALATLRALDACLHVFYLGSAHPALMLDDVVETSVGDFPVAVVMITASEKVDSTPLVASCPLVGMSDLAIILATLQASTRVVSHWLAWGDRTLASEEPARPQ